MVFPAMVFLISLSFQAAAQEIPVIPYPSKVSTQQGQFDFGKTVTIQYSDFDQGQSSQYIQEEFMDRFGIYGRIETDGTSDIQFSSSPEANDSEAYQLTIGSSIKMTGSETGLFLCGPDLISDDGSK